MYDIIYYSTQSKVGIVGTFALLTITYRQCATDTVSVSVSADISVSVSLSVSADTDFYIGR